MAGEQAEKALGRIEAALDRIERAAERSETSRRQLEAKHATLRSAVQAALADIDDLIGGQSR